MKNVFYIALLSLILWSCKKETFEHSSEEYFPESCVCSHVQDSIPGTYTGQLVLREFISYDWVNLQAVTNTILDTTITIEVSRIWSNSYYDSLQCVYNIPYFFEKPVTFTSNSTTIPGWKYDSQFFFASDNVVGDPYYLRISNRHRVNEWISVDTYSFWGIRQ